jgi:peptidoglycan/LPS O-acetylase OafA/YrhL
MPRRIDLGRAVLSGGAALLLISLFTEWYDTGPTGWEVFESLDLVLAAIALAAVVAAIRPDALPPAAAWALPGAALVIVIVQIVNSPPAAGDGDPSTGAWLALAGSLLMAAGSALSLAAISVTVHVREREVRRRVPAVDRRAEREAAEAEDLDADAGTGPASGGGSVAADDLERTQPLTGLREPDVEDPERP